MSREAIRKISFGELSDELADLLRPRVERLGYLEGFFQIAAHQPGSLAAFYRWTEELKAALPLRLVEVSDAELAAVELGACTARSKGHGCADSFDRLCELVGDAKAVGGCLMAAARYFAHAVMANTWRLKARVPSPLSTSAR